MCLLSSRGTNIKYNALKRRTIDQRALQSVIQSVYKVQGNLFVPHKTGLHIKNEVYQLLNTTEMTEHICSYLYTNKHKPYILGYM